MVCGIYADQVSRKSERTKLEANGSNDDKIIHTNKHTNTKKKYGNHIH